MNLANLASPWVAAALFCPRHLWKHCWIHSTPLNSFSAHRNPRWYAVWFSFHEWEKKAFQNLRLESCQRVWGKPGFYWVQSWRSWRHWEASTVLGHIVQAQQLLRGKWRLLEAASTRICGARSLHGGLTLPPPRPTLLSPSMTMTGTAVAGQRCLAGRGLSQFHRTMIWKGQGSLDGWLRYPSRSPSKGSACRNDLVKLHFKVSPHPHTLQTRNLH